MTFAESQEHKQSDWINEWQQCGDNCHNTGQISAQDILKLKIKFIIYYYVWLDYQMKTLLY